MTVMRRVQEDAYGRLLADAFFADVPIVLQRDALVASEIAKRLAALNSRSGKTGAAVFVLMPEVHVPEPNLPGPSTQIVQHMLFIENPTINASTLGTGKSAEALVLAGAQLFHHFIPYGITQVFVATGPAITPNDDVKGHVAYILTVTAAVALARPRKCAMPTIALSSPTAPTTVTLSCITSGAAIRYTLDGSYPSPANEAAELYSAPFALAAAATLRVSATKIGLQQSDIQQEVIA